MKAILSEHILARKKIEAGYFGMTDAAAEAKKETEVMAGAVSKAAGGFRKYQGIMASSPACLTGLSPGVRKAVNDFAEPEEPEADVMKYK